jgi:hypothetical protein
MHCAAFMASFEPMEHYNPVNYWAKPPTLKG